ncbi:MAG TPA: protein kinase [Jatrophihabitans sp.]
MARRTWRLPGYRVEALIGAGASGEVWRASVTSTGVPVALKRIWLSERAERDAAIGEAAMLSTLDHPHLMKLHEVRTTEDAIVLVLDLAAAGALSTLLARRGRLTPGETVTALAPIGSALAYAHNRGVTHGDVSAANILFTDIGLPLLADLGVARLLDDVVPVRTTPSYADPVVAAGGVPRSESDVFMLAAVTLHALTGAVPWPGSDAAEVLETAATTGRQPDFADRMLDAGVPADMTRVVARALDLDPARRGTAAEFALDLRQSAEPVAVELTAGRARHAADPLQSWPLESVPLSSIAPPATSASGAVAPPFARTPLTYGVRAPAPFTRAPGARHQARRARSRRLVLALALVLLAVSAAVAWWPRHPPARRAAAGETAAVEPVVTTRRAGSTTRPATPDPAPGTSSPPGRPGVTAVLAALDGARARAFAVRDPALLARVYASPLLLARDRATLLRIVPPGCGLTGLHTSFGEVHTRRLGSRVRVQARVAVRAATLVCRGTPAARAAPVPVVPMRIVLRRTVAGYRIVAERVG